MRALVIGSYPPLATPQAKGTMALVRELASDGRNVEVLGPPHSAALHRARIDGPAGAMELWKRHRKYDEVYVVIDGLLRHPAGRLSRVTRVVDCAAWGYALRFVKNAALVVRDPGTIPGSVGGRSGRLLWEHAARILVPNEYSASMLIDLGGAPADRVSASAAPVEVASEQWDRDWSAVSDQASAAAEIQRRAARDRRQSAR